MCNNCIKSKRACEGYNQRVVFKDPLGAYPYVGSLAPYGYNNGLPNHFALPPQQTRISGQGPLPTIAPKPPSFGYQQPPQSLQYDFPFQPIFTGPGNSATGFDIDNGAHFQFSPYVQQPNPLAPLAPQVPHAPLPVGPQLMPFQDRSDMAPYNAANLPQNASVNMGQYMNPALGGIQKEQPAHLDAEAAVKFPIYLEESSDEEASMPDSDDGELPSKTLMAPVVRNIRNPASRHAGVRKFVSFNRNDVVGEYMDSPYATDLKDGAKRRLFEHFIRITGPSISLYERHSCDSPERISNGTVPGGNSNIWSCERILEDTCFALMKFRYVSDHRPPPSCPAPRNVGNGKPSNFQGPENSLNCGSQTLPSSLEASRTKCQDSFQATSNGHFGSDAVAGVLRSVRF